MQSNGHVKKKRHTWKRNTSHQRIINHLSEPSGAPFYQNILRELLCLKICQIKHFFSICVIRVQKRNVGLLLPWTTENRANGSEKNLPQNSRLSFQIRTPTKKRGEQKLFSKKLMIWLTGTPGVIAKWAFVGFSYDREII